MRAGIHLFNSHVRWINGIERWKTGYTDTHTHQSKPLYGYIDVHDAISFGWKMIWFLLLELSDHHVRFTLSLFTLYLGGLYFSFLFSWALAFEMSERGERKNIKVTPTCIIIECACYLLESQICVHIALL